MDGDNILWAIVIGAAGSILGHFFLKYVVASFSYLIRFWKRYPISREWFTYHWSCQDGAPIFRQGTMNVDKGFFYDYVVKFTTSNVGQINAPELIYKGRMYREGQYWVASFPRIKEETEELLWRFTAPYPGGDEILTGIFAGQDMNNTAISGVVFISKYPLNEEKVNSLIEERITLFGSESILRINLNF